MAADGAVAGRAVRVVMNPRAGGIRDPAELGRILAALGQRSIVEPVPPTGVAERVARVARLAEAGRLASALRLRGVAIVGVAGGDGTQRAAAAALLGTGSALLPLPTGRLNHFAARLGMATPLEVVRALREGRVTGMPVGLAAGDVFLNTAIAGPYARVVRIRERMRPFLTTWPAAALALGLLFPRPPRVPLTVRTPGREMEIGSGLVWVGVGRDSFPAPHDGGPARSDDSLHVVVLRGARRGALMLIRSLLRHRRGRDPLAGAMGTESWNTPWVELDSADPLPLTLDGEPRSMAPPVRLRFEPRGPAVVLPRLSRWNG